jgi:hypothetical protein
MIRETYSGILVLAALLAVVAISPGTGCKRDEGSRGRASAATNTAQLTESQAEPSAIARVVFVGKQNACDCTRRRIGDSWAALQAALDGRQDIPVERIRVDTDPANVAPYEQMRAIMVLPAVYFMDSSGRLAQMLQGEINEQQVADVIDGRRSAP